MIYVCVCVCVWKDIHIFIDLIKALKLGFDFIVGRKGEKWNPNVNNMRFTELDNYNEAFCLTQLNLNSMLAHLILACLFIAPPFLPSSHPLLLFYISSHAGANCSLLDKKLTTRIKKRRLLIKLLSQNDKKKRWEWKTKMKWKRGKSVENSNALCCSNFCA